MFDNSDAMRSGNDQRLVAAPGPGVPLTRRARFLDDAAYGRFARDDNVTSYVPVPARVASSGNGASGGSKSNPNSFGLAQMTAAATTRNT